MRLLMAILIVYPLSIAAQGIDDIIKSLKNVECYESTVKYQVLMSLQADVSYTVKLNSMNAPGDSPLPTAKAPASRPTMTVTPTISVATDCWNITTSGTLYRSDRADARLPPFPECSARLSSRLCCLSSSPRS